MCIVNGIYLKKCSKPLSNWQKREHMKLFATGPVLMRFVMWHNEESARHNMETNWVLITTILRYLHPTLNHTVFTYNIGHCSTVARYIALLSSEVIDFIIFFALSPLSSPPSVCWWFILLRYFVSCYCSSNQRLLNELSILR